LKKQPFINICVLSYENLTAAHTGHSRSCADDPLLLTNQISAYQIQKVESSQRCLYRAFWLVDGIPWDGNYKGRLHMTYCGLLSDLHTIV